jgi:hypothetical protein
MFLYNNTPINIYNEFEGPDGTRYPNLLDPTLRETLGVVEVPDPPTYDQRFYWDVDIPKQLEDEEVITEDGETITTKGLKSQWISEVKRTCNQLLNQTDWTIIRKAERDIPVPENIATYREAVLAECDRLELAIEGAADITAFIDVVTNQNWPEL